MPEQELHHVAMLYQKISKVFKGIQRYSKVKIIKRLEKLWKILDDVNDVYLRDQAQESINLPHEVRRHGLIMTRCTFLHTFLHIHVPLSYLS